MTFAAERHALEERNSAVEALKPLHEKLASGERLTVEERASADGYLKIIGERESEIRTYEQARELSAATAPPAPNGDSGPNAVEARERDFSAYLKRGVVSPELRAAGEATGSAGGYIVPPGWWQRLQVAMKAFGGSANDFFPLDTDSGQPMNWATVDPTTTVATLITENTTVSDVDYTFGQGVLGAYMFVNGAQKVSYQLANDSAFDAEAFVIARIGEAHGRAQAQYAISGTGTNQPLGVVTALGAKGNAGTSGGTIAGTGGYVTLGAAGVVKNFAGSTTELIANTLNPTKLLSMIAAVDPAYRDLGAKWYLNDNQIIGLRGEVDSNGRPLINLQDGLTQGAIGTLFGYPVMTDQNIPNLAASTVGGPMFGHLATAMVKRNVTQSGILRLNERYADSLQVAWIGHTRWDLRSNDLRAAVTVKPAAT
jgi:HK97 family phage major capsid protein